MNTELLKTFLEVAKTRHFGQAADNLFITQAAVSSRIKQLESLIGTQVFTRQRNNILLTSAGERLLPHAQGMLASWQLAVQEVGVPSKADTQLTIGGTSNLWDTFLQSLLPQLSSEFEKLYLRTEIANSQDLVRLLIAGRVDIAATLDPPSNVDFESQRIGEIELIMACKQRGLNVTDITSEGFVFVDWGTAFNLLQVKLVDDPVTPILQTGQSRIALEYILSHQGAAYLPKALVQPYIDEGILFQVTGALEESKDVFAVYNNDTANSEVIEQVAAFLLRQDIKPEVTLSHVDDQF